MSGHTAICAPIPDPATWVWLGEGDALPPGFMVLAAHAECGTALTEHLASPERLAGAVGRVLVACFMADVGRAQLMELAARPAELAARPAELAARPAELAARPAELAAFCERQRIAPRDMQLTLRAFTCRRPRRPGVGQMSSGRIVTVSLPPTLQGVLTVDNFSPACGAGPVTVSIDSVTGLPRANGSIDGAVGQIDLLSPGGQADFTSEGGIAGFAPGGSYALNGLAPGADGQTIRLRNASGPVGADATVTLVNLAATSYPNWQFQCTRDGFVIAPNEVATAVYRADIGKWVVS